MPKKTKIDNALKYELTQIEENGVEHTLTTIAAHPIECKVYKRRWVILLLFMIFGTISSMSWIQYAIITNIIMRYYNVSSYAVDWTSIIFMFSYIFFIFPATYIIEKKGIRFSVLIGSLGTAIGSWLKVASVAQDRFIVTFIGQALVGTCQVFLLSLPPIIAAVWFGPSQISTACSLGVFGIQFGVAVGFFLPPLLIKNHENVDDIGSDLSFFFYSVAGFTTVIFILVLIFFEEAPLLPPSPAQALQRETKQDGFLSSLKRLVSNHGYKLHLIAYGINLGVFNSLCTLLNQIMLVYFPNGEEFAGRVGVVITLSGMFFGVVAGIILDKTHKFKETTLCLYVAGALGLAFFAYTLAWHSSAVTYLTALFVGACLGGYMPVGFELAVELTYPEPEGTAAGLLLFTCQVVSSLFTFAYSWMIPSMGDRWSNAVLCATLVLGALLTALIPPRMRRQDAIRTGS